MGVRSDRSADLANGHCFARFHQPLAITSHLIVYFADGDLYVQPFLELCLFRPERTHFGKCVAVDHCSVTSTDYADYTDLRKEKKSQVNCQVVQHGFASLRNLRNLWIFLSYFRAVELTKYLARYQVPPCSTSVNVSMP